MKTILQAQAAALILLTGSPAFAQDEQPEEPRRIRVGLGAQLVPSFPGSDEVSVRPMFNLDIARGDTPFVFEAPDESIGFSLFGRGGFGFGPAFSFEGSRRASDIGAPLDKVSTTVEGGGFVQYEVGPRIRVRAELRRGLGGHNGLVGNIGADYIVRDGDNYVFSVGPRVSLSDGRYQRAYFGVTPAEAVLTGLPAFRPSGGVHAVGATAGLLYQLTPRWGIMSYARYDRLIDDAGRSPVVRRLGSRDQLSGGLGLTYTFGGR